MTQRRREQRKREFGWKKPENSFCCTRPYRYGNYTDEGTAESFCAELDKMNHWELVKFLIPLRDYDILLCFCPLDAPSCHVDVLIGKLNAIWPRKE